MLVLPMRSHDSSPNRQNRDSCIISVPALHRDTSPHTSEFRKHVAGAMLSMRPSTVPPTPKRPKLSLQTAVPPSPPTKRLGASLNILSDSPTTRNTHANTIEAPLPTSSSAVQAHTMFPFTSITPPSTIPSFTTPGSSPSLHGAPYVLPIGAHSILRNSPLPRRHLSAITTRAAKRMFPPVKRVAFQEGLAEIAPTPLIKESSDVGSDTESTEEYTEDEHQRRREEIQAEDGHTVPIHSRRKRMEWIWRPLEDDILMQHDMVELLDGIVTPLTKALPHSTSECYGGISEPSS